MESYHQEEEQRRVIIEKLAEIIHDMWVVWSHHVADREKVIKERLGISEKCLERWADYWKSYSELSEEVKELDRFWARKIIKALEEEEII